MKNTEYILLAELNSVGKCAKMALVYKKNTERMNYYNVISEHFVYIFSETQRKGDDLITKDKLQNTCIFIIFLFFVC